MYLRDFRLAMAVNGSNELSRSEKEDSSVAIFEENLKERLCWSKKRWSSSVEANSRMNKLCNSMEYWSKKLKAALDSTSVIVTLFNYEKDVKVSLLEIVDGLFAMDKKVDVILFSDFRNPRYLCLHFKDEETKSYVEKYFRKANGNYVVYLSWALDPQQIKVKVHWLTMNTDVNIIKKHLESYFVFKEEKSESLSLLSGKVLRSGKVKFKVNMKEGVCLEDVPHLTQIAGLETLITIKGRLPLCLTCDKIGHIAKVCPTPFCVKCRKLKSKDHSCDGGTRSYANIVEGVKTAAEFDEWNVDKASDLESRNRERDLEFKSAYKVNEILKKQYANNDNFDVNASNVLPSNNIGERNESSVSQSDSMVSSRTDELVSKIVDNTQGVWGDSDDEEDTKEDSDVDLSQIAGYTDMKSYIQELNAFKVEQVDKGGGDVNLSGSRQFKNVEKDDMDIDAKATKRKISESNSVAKKEILETSSSGRDWVKVYGRGGRRGRRESKTSSVFDDKNEKREFVFSD